MVKNPPANAEDIRVAGSLPGSERSPGGANGTALRYSCLEDFMDRGAWWTIVQGAIESDTTECMHTHTKPRKFSLYDKRKVRARLPFTV